MPFALDNEKLESADMNLLDMGHPPTKAIAHQEYPKMVYLHPKDKSKTHLTKIVNNANELGDAEAAGWRMTPHVPIEVVESLHKDFEAATPEAKVDPLDEMTKAQLVDYAKEYGISIDVADKKEVILAAIKAAS